ncbi:autotransporter family porin [Enterobacter sp. BIGb0383]|uniref:autotransporter outer membrane beta-barrel domain-containing protein n=1 Tax=unclassified Enterobacter TaxID=2608935 RepID=UPI000F953475|nr:MULTISPECIES: autotransporter outer membrane beta-barrel domain-containing protein [unclassified Enterobacter]ROP61809.1 autotransporter family porin [Enterobacter sp. BIGb0383]ROS11970.1 autotransporter family porin [Enterobacter sp. BIGb0359]
MLKLSKLYVSLFAGAAFSVGATEYNRTVDTSVTPIQTGDSVNIDESANTALGIFAAGNAVNIGDSGRIQVDLQTSKANARGIDMSASTGNHLGSGTAISVKSTATTGGAAIGLNMAKVDLSATGLQVSVDSTGTGIGIDATGGSQVNLGNGTSAVVTAKYAASGVYINGSSLQADSITVESNANTANGILVTGNNSNINLGNHSVINVNAGENSNSGGGGLSLSGNNNTFSASSLIIQATGSNARGVSLDNTGAASAIDLGENTTIVTSGKSGAGIYSGVQSLAQLKATGLNLHTMGEAANGIEAHNGTIVLDGGSQVVSDLAGGVLALNEGSSGTQTPKIVLTDSVILANTLGAKAEGENAAVMLKNTQVQATKGVALQAVAAGHVDFSGSTTLLTGAANALESTGQGSLISGSGTAAIAGNIIANDRGNVTLDLTDGSVIKGSVMTSSDARSDIALSGESTWISGGNSTVSQLVLNNSSLIVSGENASPATGNRVTVTGDYRGDNGQIVFNTVLAGDDSATDQLIVNGNTSGFTRVAVNNLGGQGAETHKGIEIIKVNGSSDGIFEQYGRIVAGAWEYNLTRGTGDDDKNWYLISAASGQHGPVIPDAPPQLRPEGGSYVDNIAAANTLFNMTMADRLGETDYVDILTGERKVTSLWLRQVGSHNRWRDSNGQLKTQGNRYVAQLGGDVASWQGSDNHRLHLGVMAGYGTHQSTTKARGTGYTSKGSTEGYSTGIYASWLQNEALMQGAYVDSWIQYGWFNHSVKGADLSPEKYKSSGVSASLESGYDYRITGSAGQGSGWFVRPQAQVIWSDIKARDHQEENGTRVKSGGEGNVQTRLGVRSYLKGTSSLDAHTDRVFEPFVEANWLHNSHRYSVMMDSVAVQQGGTRNIAELKTGVDARLSRNVSAWGNVAQQVGDKGYSNTSAMLGVKYAF